jgi:hypothetical protein
MAAGHAQGRVNFWNDGFTLIKYVPAGGSEAVDLPPTPGLFYFALFSAPVGTTDPDSPAFTYYGHIGTNRAFAGRFSGGTAVLPIPGDLNRHLAMLVRSWSANAGTTWQEFQAFEANPTSDYWYGASGIASDVVLGIGAQPDGVIFSDRHPGATLGFTLYPVTIPEPFPFELAGIAVGLWVFCWHRRGRFTRCRWL